MDLGDLSPEIGLLLAAEMPSKYELKELDEWVLIEEEDAQLLPETELILVDSLLILKGLRDLEA